MPNYTKPKLIYFTTEQIKYLENLAEKRLMSFSQLIRTILFTDFIKVNLKDYEALLLSSKDEMKNLKLEIQIAKNQEIAKDNITNGFKTFCKLEKQRILANKQYFKDNVDQSALIDCSWTNIDNNESYSYNYDTDEFSLYGEIITEEEYMKKKYKESLK